MTSQINNDLHQTPNNNVIIIPFSDNQEESVNETTLNINGFNIIELDEEKNDYNNLIHLYEEEQIIGIRQQIQIKSKAKMVENYYSNQPETVPNVNCSRCLLNNFEPNELLYFKDRKTLIAYLKYCFLYLKKNIFTNHSIYMNNYYDLFKINQSFYNGWKFSFEKTLCKACFLQIINMEYLIFNIKNIICDYDGVITSSPPPGKKITSFVNNKRRRIISRNKRKKPVSKIENSNTDKKENDINAQITPIVIPIQESVVTKKKKRRRSSNTIFKRRRFKNMKKRNQSKYNKNVAYDNKNNILIINKKNIGNYQIDDDSSIINSIINDNRKSAINKEKEKEKENSKQTKKKEEKLKFISSNKNESDSLSNKKTAIKEKLLDNNSKDINGNKMKNHLNKNNNLKSLETKSTIINNNINNKTGEINMDKRDLIQINNNQLENINFNFFNYSNKDFYIQNNLNQNNNNILFNNLNNNNKIFAILNEASDINKVIRYLYNLTRFICQMNNFVEYIFQNINTITIEKIIQYKQRMVLFKGEFDKIVRMFYERQESIKYVINYLKNYIFYYQKIYDLKDLINRIGNLEFNANIMNNLYTNCINNFFRLFHALGQEIDKFL